MADLVNAGRMSEAERRYEQKEPVLRLQAKQRNRRRKNKV
jgi:hypothetical protein